MRCSFKKNVTTNVFIQVYEHVHHKEMSCQAVAQLLSVMLYQRRFFPFYTYNILAGLDKEGNVGLVHFLRKNGESYSFASV